jgi:hypothetical protein
MVTQGFQLDKGQFPTTRNSFGPKYVLVDRHKLEKSVAVRSIN